MAHSLLSLNGSLRKASLNGMLLREAGRLFGGTHIEGNLRLPLYDGDLEAEGIPAEVQALADQIAAADAIIIATPEYNKSLSGVLKNALDWVSRVKGNPWRDKPVAIVSATAGRTGGEAAQFALRLAMLSFRPRLIAGPAVLIAGGADQFDAEGRLTNARYAASLEELVQALHAEVARAA
ncbi:NADPH-dependent FMN reductase domain protein [Candidatus Rhodobacter oscarellae]|uniref:NADPH-dependent FMN reductase domain protein n=1 Tax=Candidatus Rhodobacter oscarellae TaxID=1675527 RepID=A0A0J9EAX1_9RHOB|nr:NADPH-dependent FMN reductase [Candidatus Rhodobacter lobularis]KMW59771.1 NADPH-dependent FMN reductase domain protein [Candidatus Rhodobacter lobularis]